MTKARELSKLLSGTLKVGALKAPAGTTAERPTGQNGQIRYNSDLGANEVYAEGAWGTIAPPPTVSSVSPTTYNGEQGTIFTITGQNFTSDAVVKFITNAGLEFTASTVVYVNRTTLKATTPQDFTVAQEPLSVKITQGSGSIVLNTAIDCGGVPSWVTTAGQLFSLTDNWDNTFQTNYSNIATLVATDPDNSSTVTYSIASGSIPTGMTLTNGVISGLPSEVASPTTNNFIVNAVDDAGNTTQRSFSGVINHTPHYIYNDSNVQSTSVDDSGSANLINAAVRDSANPAEALNWQGSGAFCWHYSPWVNTAVSTFKLNLSNYYPNGVRINRVVHSVHGNSYGKYTLSGSNDGSNWTSLGDGHAGGLSSNSDYGKVICYFNNNKVWKYYKIEFSNTSANHARLYDGFNTGSGWASYGILFQSNNYNDIKPVIVTKSGTEFQYGATGITTSNTATGDRLLMAPYGIPDNYADFGLIPANGTVLTYDFGSTQLIDAISIFFCASGADRGGDLDLWVSNDNSTYTKLGTIALRTFLSGTGSISNLTRYSEVSNGNYAGEYIYNITSGFGSTSLRTARYLQFRFGGNLVQHHPRWSTIRALKEVKVR